MVLAISWLLLLLLNGLLDLCNINDARRRYMIVKSSPYRYRKYWIRSKSNEPHFYIQSHSCILTNTYNALNQLVKVDQKITKPHHPKHSLWSILPDVSIDYLHLPCSEINGARKKNNDSKLSPLDYEFSLCKDVFVVY